MTVERLLVSVAQAAEMLSLSQRKVYELVAAGQFTKRYVGDGKRNYRLQADEVREYARNLPTEPPE